MGAVEDSYDSLIRQLVTNAVAPAPETRSGDLFTMAAQQRTALLHRITSDAQRLSGTQGVQAYCMECPVEFGSVQARESQSMIAQIGAWLAR